MIEIWEKEMILDIHALHENNVLEIVAEKDRLIAESEDIYLSAKSTAMALDALSGTPAGDAVGCEVVKLNRQNKALQGGHNTLEANLDKALADIDRLEVIVTNQGKLIDQLQADNKRLTRIVADQQDTIDRHNSRIGSLELIGHDDFVNLTKGGQRLLKLLIAKSKELSGKALINLSYREAGISSSTMQAGVSSLVKHGFIEVVRKGNHQDKKATLYKILYDKK